MGHIQFQSVEEFKQSGDELRNKLLCMFADIRDLPLLIPIGYEEQITNFIEHDWSNVCDFDPNYVGDKLVESEDLLTAGKSYHNEMNDVLSELSLDNPDLNHINCGIRKLYKIHFIIMSVINAKFKELNPMENEIEAIEADFSESFDDANSALTGMEDYFSNENAFTNKLLVQTGTEGFVAGMIFCHGGYDPMLVSGSEGFIEGIKNGIVATGKFIMNILRNIKEFFFGKKKTAKEHIEDAKKVVKECLEKIKAMSDDEYKPDPVALKSTVDYLKRNGMENIGTELEQADTKRGAIAALVKAVVLLDEIAKEELTAEQAIKDAEQAVNEASTVPSGLSEDMSDDERKAINAEQKKKVTEAKERLAKAKEKVKRFFACVSGYGKVQQLAAKLAKKKSEQPAERVAGNESFLY